MSTAVLENTLEEIKPSVDIAKALELRLKKHMSYSEIGKLMNVSAQAVHQRLQKFTTLLDDPDMLQAHDGHVDRLLTGAMHKVLCAAVDDDKIKNSGTLQLVTSYGILFDKQRLVRGQATSIVSNVDLTPEEREQLRVLDAKIISQDTQDVVSDVISMDQEVINTNEINKIEHDLS